MIVKSAGGLYSPLASANERAGSICAMTSVNNSSRRNCSADWRLQDAASPQHSVAPPSNSVAAKVLKPGRTSAWVVSVLNSWRYALRSCSALGRTAPIPARQCFGILNKPSSRPMQKARRIFHVGNRKLGVGFADQDQSQHQETSSVPNSRPQQSRCRSSPPSARQTEPAWPSGAGACRRVHEARLGGLERFYRILFSEGLG